MVIITDSLHQVFPPLFKAFDLINILGLLKAKAHNSHKQIIPFSFFFLYHNYQVGNQALPLHALNSKRSYSHTFLSQQQSQLWC